MEKFRFDLKLSLEDLLSDLMQDTPEGFVNTELFDVEDRDGDLWHVIAFDDKDKIAPGFKERFLSMLNTPIPHCGV